MFHSTVYYTFLVTILLLGIILCKITRINPGSIPQLIYGKIWVFVHYCLTFSYDDRERHLQLFFTNVFSVTTLFCAKLAYLVIIVIYIYIYMYICQSVISVIQSCPPHRKPNVLKHSHASLSITNCRSLLKVISIESAIPCNHLILCHPLFLLSSIFSSLKVFSSESALCIS